MDKISTLFNKITKVYLILLFIAGCTDSPEFDQLSEQEVEAIPSGSIIITSNSNGTTGPGIISVWTPTGDLDRVLYDYTKVGVGYASGVAFVSPTQLFVVTDTGGGASNDFLDFFDYRTPFANPLSLFTSLVSGAATTYMRQMALVTDTAANRYLAFIAESGSNRVARLSSMISEEGSGLNFTRDYNFAANGTCTLATPYGVALIPTTGNIAVVASAASGRINIFDQTGTCVGSTAMTNFPTGAAYHSVSGKVLVTYSGNSSISAHNITTGAQSPASAIYTSAGQLSTPRAIAADSAGYIYVGSDGTDQVVKLYWDGVTATASYIGTVIQTSVFTQNITSITVVP